MTKALSSMTPKERDEAIHRRLATKTGGIGYWAAVDAEARKKRTEKK